MRKRFRRRLYVHRASDLEAVFILLMIFLIVLFSFHNDDYLFKRKVAIYEEIVARYHMGQYQADTLKPIVSSDNYVSDVIKKYQELRNLTHKSGRRDEFLSKYVGEKLELNSKIPPELDKNKLKKDIIEAVLDATLGKASKIFKIRDIDPELLVAIIERESSFNPFAFNPNGNYKIVKNNQVFVDSFPAYGLMQIWHPTFSWINRKYFGSKKKVEELFNIKTNVLFGAILLQYLYNSEIMAHLAGLEPATSGSGVQCSIP